MGSFKALVKYESDKRYYDSLDWEEVPMWKAIKLWGHNQRHVKCIVGNSYYFYSGYSKMTDINHDQVKEGKWFVNKM